MFDLIEQLRTRKSKTIQPIADALAGALSNFSGPRNSMRIGPRAFEWGTRTYVMGILNLSPDSFAGDGLTDVEAAVQRAAQFARDGADLIDLGGESTRPGSEPISVEEVLQRVIPVIERTAQEVEVPISIDTYKAAVARQALA
ncbi:MAG: dihydropteroate synthase, partial [Chloroflexi bacterium]|nr:dihydropteroate synthase [Chloroflexota bacterium]